MSSKGVVRRARRAGAALVVAMLLVAGCAPIILPSRTKPGGAAKWAEVLAFPKALEWSPDATLVRVTGAGIGIEGWLPDRGGEWRLAYVSAARKKMLEVAVDADGKVQTVAGPSPEPPPQPLPPAWLDSPRVFAATRRHWQHEPLHVLEAELSSTAEPARAAGAVAWRIRFWLADGTSETHVVTPDARWLAMYQ